MNPQEIYNQDYRHFDSLIWQVPAWGTAVFSLSMTAAALVIGNITTIEQSLPVSGLKSLSLFLFSIFFVLILLKNVYLKFRLHQHKGVMFKDYF